MRVISSKKLREFWSEPRYAGSEASLKAWRQVVNAADWTCFVDVRNTYNSANFVGNKVVFNVGGAKYRVIAVIDYEGHKLFVRFVLTHEEYDKGNWKEDTFGEDWKPRSREEGATPKSQRAKSRANQRNRRKGRHRK